MLTRSQQRSHPKSHLESRTHDDTLSDAQHSSLDRGRAGIELNHRTDSPVDGEPYAVADLAEASDVTAISDDDIMALGGQAKIKVIRLSDLPLPPEKEQLDFLLEAATLVETNPGDQG